MDGWRDRLTDALWYLSRGLRPKNWSNIGQWSAFVSFSHYLFQLFFFFCHFLSLLPFLPFLGLKKKGWGEGDWGLKHQREWEHRCGGSFLIIFSLWLYITKKRVLDWRTHRPTNLRSNIHSVHFYWISLFIYRYLISTFITINIRFLQTVLKLGLT